IRQADSEIHAHATKDLQRELVALLTGFEDHLRSAIVVALQDRVGITRTRFTRHAYNRSRRGKDFETTATAARTGDTAKRIDAHVSDLRRRTVDATPQLPIENYAAADARAECDADDRLAADGRALPHLADCSGVRVVLEKRGEVELFG